MTPFLHPEIRMRTAALFSDPTRVLAAVVCLLAATGPVAAEAPRVRIASTQVGLPPGSGDGTQGHVCKFAAWAPVYVELEVLAPVAEPAELVVETPDADGVTTTLAVPLDLASVAPGTILRSRDFRLMPYLRPAAGTGETTVTVRAGGAAISEPFRVRSLRPRPALTYVVLSLGGRLPGFDLPRPSSGTGEEESTGDPTRGGRVELAAIADAGQLPDQWFGYSGADLVILTTSNADLVGRLFAANAPPFEVTKRNALLEWVRRGGRLVVTVGANAELVSRLAALQPLLPQAIRGDAPSRSVNQLTLFWAARETSTTSTVSGNLVAKGTRFPVASLRPGPESPGRVVIPPPSRQTDDREPVAVQAALGLGRVTLIGFDLDRPPFTDSPLRAEFWDWVLREGGANRASVGSEGKPRPPSATPTDDEDEVAAALRTHLDTFDGIPVVTFGSVAFLIALYLVLVGPVEYYFLKRVFARLEYTWVTFPLIVLTVCVAAYLTAVAVKGRELRVNKLDVVDVVAAADPQTGRPAGRVYGNTWFTVFSPRNDSFTVGATPAEGWTTRGQSSAGVVGWVGGPRSGQASLLRRRYGVHVDAERHAVADGLTGVPAQVWSTKSFTASWAGPVDTTAPVVESRLEHPPGDPTSVFGTFVNRMPFDAVTDCVAFYAGQAFPVGTILSGQEVRLVLDKGQPANQWLQEKGQLGELLGRVSTTGGATASGGTPTTSATAATAGPSNGLPLWGMLFHESALRNDVGVIPRNASLRRLDQSWRLAPDVRDEVLVVGRVPPASGPSEELFGGSASPSRLWLKGLPGDGARPQIPGTGRQETYVRLYLPVTTPARVAGR